MSKPIDLVVINGATSISTTLPITGIGLIIIPIAAVIACTLSLANKTLYKVILGKNNKYKKQYKKDQQTIKTFDKT